MATSGIVYLIGAGPGSPDLITVRGFELLSRADTVVYDNLIPAELIVRLPETVEKIYVGKQSDRHTLPQEQINELLVRLAGEGKTVARLKGADPLVFGRGGEEADYLKTNDIPFEIVPGVTAAAGATAYSGIPCTDRRLSAWALLATGHKAADGELPTVPWEWVAQAKNGTLIIYMGVGQVKEIVASLTDGGLESDTPAAVVERATLPTQRVFTGILGELPDIVLREQIHAPALFIIGQSVTLRDRIDWFGRRPLHGKRIMVLRPADQAVMVYASLRELGAEVLPYPTIATRPSMDQQAWGKVQQFAAAERWLVFTSENGVRYFMNQFPRIVGDLRALAQYHIAAVGVGTSRALAQYGLQADFLPDKATVAELGRQLAGKHRMEGAQVVRVEGNLSDDTIPDTLREAGAEVARLPVYETYHPRWADGFKERLLSHRPDIIMFTSGSTVNGLFEILSSEEIQVLTKDARLASIGPSTSDTLRDKGLKVAIEAKEHSLPGMIDEIMAHVLQKGDGQ